MLKCDFTLRNFHTFTFEITLRHGCSPVNLMHIFRIPLEGCFLVIGKILINLYKPTKKFQQTKNKKIIETVLQC